MEGALVRLEPLSLAHAPYLAAAAGEDRRSYRYTWVPDGLADAERYVRAALKHQQSGRVLPWAVRRLADDTIVGSTRFLDLEVFTWPPPWPPELGRGPEPAPGLPPTVAEIGSTWYAASAQRSGVNTEVKWLQLTHAFEVWQVRRVTLKTDVRNGASRAAIEALGARFEGVRRAHAPASDGTVRDTAYYSITAGEWPDVKACLVDRLHAAHPAEREADRGVRVRVARPEDYETIVGVVDDWWGRPVCSSLPRLFLDHFWSTSRVAEDQQGLAGFLVGFYSPSEPQVAYVHFVGVRPDHRKRGLARRLYDDFAHGASQHGCTELQAITAPNNSGSVGFHQSLDFVVNGPATDYNGPGRPMVTFRRQLS